MFDALLEIATYRGLASGPSRQTDALKAQRVAELSTALQVFDARQRALAVRDVGCRRGLSAFPGMPACRSTSLGDAP